MLIALTPAFVPGPATDLATIFFTQVIKIIFNFPDQDYTPVVI